MVFSPPDVSILPSSASALSTCSVQQHPSISASLAPPACDKHAKNTVCPLQLTKRLHTHLQPAAELDNR